MTIHSSNRIRPSKRHIISRIKNKIRSCFFLDQWIVLLAPSTGYKSLSWDDFKPLVPPLDRLWADPFIWVDNNTYYIFIEEMIYSTNRGRIACLTLDKEMNILSNQIVLERPYHLSYPFIFEHEGQLYMIPETGKNHGIELYRCARFPDQWIFERNLISNLYAVDATLLKKGDRWWLFANIRTEGGSTEDTLHLYYADHPFLDSWTPHPLNPIVKDIYSARPAGRIFLEDGILIRPSQDCSARYGYATNFYRIITLTETDYAEVHEHTFYPQGKGGILGIHTYNDMAGITVIDAEQRRPRFLGQISAHSSRHDFSDLL